MASVVNTSNSFNSYAASLEKLGQALAALPDGKPVAQEQNMAVRVAAEEVCRSGGVTYFDFSKTTRSDYLALSEKIFNIQKKMAAVSEFSGVNSILLTKVFERGNSVFDLWRNDLVLRHKIQLLNLIPSRASKAAELISLIREMGEYFDDADFLFKVMESLAYNNPRFLCDNLKSLPLKDGEKIFQIGALLRNADHRQIFAAHFKMSKEELEKAHLKYIKNRGQYVDVVCLGRGICNGYTTTLASQPLPKHDEDSFRKARFIQAAYELNVQRQSKQKELIGKAILENPQDYPFVIAKAMERLNFKCVDDLINAFKASGKHSKYSNLVGCLVFTCHPVIAELYVEKQKCIREIDEHIAANPSQKSLLEDERSKLVKECQILESEARKMKELSCLYPEAPRLHEAPGLVLAKYNLKKPEPVVANAPIAQLSSSLMASKGLQGKFALSVIAPGFGHTVFVSFNPLCFSDINDCNLVTFYPQARGGFKDVGEMVSSIENWMGLTYGKLNAFSLARIAAPIPVMAQPLAPAPAPVMAQPLAPAPVVSPVVVGGQAN